MGKWDRIKTNLNSNIGYEKYEFQIVENLIKYLIVFFRTKYSKSYLIEKSYKNINEIKKLRDDEDDDNDLDLKLITDMNISELLFYVNDIEFKYFYDYILESINYFKITLYGKKIIINQKGKD